MKAEELRIGNYILLDGGKHKIRRDTLINILRGVSNLKPIPLTEEILLKCGFKHKGNGFYEILGCFIELCNVGDEFYYCGFKGKSIGNIKHLHQLQNLYYCLTGEELNIKL